MGSLFSKEAILDKIAVALGGRAAEEIFVGKISTGAADDLDKVTKMAYSMVTVYGMNPELGLLSYGQTNASEQFYKPYSDATGQMIDQEAKAIVEQQYTRVKALLREKSDIMNALADDLCEKETLVYKDLHAVLGDRPFDIKESHKAFATAGSPFAIRAEDETEEDSTNTTSGTDTPPTSTPADASAEEKPPSATQQTS